MKNIEQHVLADHNERDYSVASCALGYTSLKNQ